MINTRISIFKSLLKKLKQLTKHGNTDAYGFKTILYGVILNDLKEWSEYIPNDDHTKIVNILNDYILEHKDFEIYRFVEDNTIYRNVNTPLDNTTWRRLWDNKDFRTASLQKNKTFEIQDDVLIFNPILKGKHLEQCPTCPALSILLHDQTLFENDRQDEHNPNLVPVQ